MRVIVFEDARWRNFLPLVYLRPICKLVCGTEDLLFAIQWLGAEAKLGAVELWCRPQIAAFAEEETRLQINQPLSSGSLLLNGRGRWRSLPDVNTSNNAWVGIAAGDNLACVYTDEETASSLNPSDLLEGDFPRCLSSLPTKSVDHLVDLKQWPWELVNANADAIENDWVRYRHSAAVLGDVSTGCQLLGDDLFIGNETVLDPGVVVDSRSGPVWIGSNVRIGANSVLQGPASIGDGSQLLPGAFEKDGCTVGNTCKIGGEVTATIFHDCSNKQHHGFLGNSYVGSWVNIGAGTSNSNLKNTYGTVSVPINGNLVESSEQFVGLLVGDHAKIGINVTFPTGGVVGVCSSVFTSRSPKFVPSFSWIDEDRRLPYDPVRGLEVARRVARRRATDLSQVFEKLFLEIQGIAAEIETAVIP